VCYAGKTLILSVPKLMDVLADLSIAGMVICPHWTHDTHDIDDDRARDRARDRAHDRDNKIEAF